MDVVQEFKVDIEVGEIEVEESPFNPRGGVPMGRQIDHYKDAWRLDVDDWSYEQLLDLCDKIGYVKTGLKDVEIRKCLRRQKFSSLSAKHSVEIETKCSICQEEFSSGDEIGRLHCGHFHHVMCIEGWLAEKKTCPMCKKPAISPA